MYSGCKSDIISSDEKNNLVFDINYNDTLQSGDTTWFLFKPSTNVKLDYIISSLPDSDYSYSTYNNNISTVFQKDNWYYFEWFPGVQSGQEWTYDFYGWFEDNDAFHVISYYTVP